jgi:spore coat protein U-like protein
METLMTTKKIALITLALSVATLAQAATSTANFTSRIVISSACTVSATNMDFGTQGTLANAIDTTSTINVTCTNLTPYTVAISQGSMGTSVSNRKMKITASGLEAVSYMLYRNSGRTLNWGNTNGIDTMPGVGNGTLQPITVYGRVPSQASVTAGTYTDTLTVTLTY